MGSFSKLSALFSTAVKPAIVQQTRNSGGAHHVLHVTATKWSHFQWKDMANFYVFLGLIPMSLLVMYNHIFIGPATLKEIPEGYIPKDYEHEKNAISRFIAKYVTRSYQELYEMEMHNIYEEDYKRRMRLLEKKVGQLMRARSDYKSSFYVPITDKHLKVIEEDEENYKKSDVFQEV